MKGSKNEGAIYELTEFYTGRYQLTPMASPLR
jgi:hypothetical protein